MVTIEDKALMRQAGVAKNGERKDEFGLPTAADYPTAVNVFALLVRNKWLFVLVSVLPPIVAGIMLSITPPVFESRAVVLIGEAIHAIEPPDLVAERLRETYTSSRVGTSSMSRAVLQEVKINRAARSVISIIAQGTDPSATQKFLESVTEKLLADHRRILDVVEDRVRQRLAVVERHIGSLGEKSTVLSREARAAKDGGLVAAMVLEKSRVEERLEGLEQERVKLRADLQNYALKSTRLLREPDLPDTPAAPKRGLILFLSLLFGTVCGAIAVLFYEHLRRMPDSARNSAG